MRGGDPTIDTSRAVLQYGANGMAVPAAPGAVMSAADAIGLNGAPNVLRAYTSHRAPFAGVLRNLFVNTDAAYGAGVGVTYTVWVNEGAGSALACTISGAAQTENSDVANSVAVAAGDRIYVGLTRSAGVPGAVSCRASLELAKA